MNFFKSCERAKSEAMFALKLPLLLIEPDHNSDEFLS
jgi:hypothetical protein